MSVFYLKRRDIRPVMVATLYKPDGTIQDITGKTVKIHVKLSTGTLLGYSDERLALPGALGSGTVLTRDGQLSATPTDGTVSYTWLDTDWGTGMLVTGGHRMEFEVLGPSTERLTFPNGGYDVLRVIDDLGQS